MDRRSEWLEKAEALRPRIFTQTVRPVSGMPDAALSEGGSVVLDFGDHFVGRLTLRLGSEGSHPDAPAWLEFKFCENARELDETLEGYRGWISKGWVQQEQIHVDVLPATVQLPRRYAFRYVKIDVLALSGKYRLRLEDAFATASTCADDGAVEPLRGDARDADIDRVARRTLRSCMQNVFEDGPKRDRRLWLGDLRLQALANYATYRNNDLVKRCLYLFAGVADDAGRLPACLFLEPRVEADDTFMFDYALFFIPTLLAYYRQTGDAEAARELLPTALRQLELSEEYFGEDGLVRDRDQLGWCFVDWNLNLNKQACAQAIWLYCANAAKELCEALDSQKPEWLEARIAARREAMLARLYDGERGLFVSGANRQVSWASQVWAVLAGVIEGEGAARCLNAVKAAPDAVGMVTPYMMHHYIEALCAVGRKDAARDAMREYWGAMVDLGADTFWELFNPDDPDESPYGSPVVNSYCHAWSCTPTWFLRSGILD
ncbi:MAG: hypothetical protein IJ089_12685 [Clostridia bacterium]|nr:hypothetical protein [Clostridia bacterium]